MDGPKPNQMCVFPFEYEGNVYQTCKYDKFDINDNTRWCSTKVDSNGKHEKGHWGNCDENCPKGCHVRNQKRQMVECSYPFSFPSIVGRGNQLFNECVKHYPDVQDSPMICYTKKNSTNNQAILGLGDWGVCEEKYCPDFQSK